MDDKDLLCACQEYVESNKWNQWLLYSGMNGETMLGVIRGIAAKEAANNAEMAIMSIARKDQMDNAFTSLDMDIKRGYEDAKLLVGPDKAEKLMQEVLEARIAAIRAKYQSKGD